MRLGESERQTATAPHVVIEDKGFSSGDQGDMVSQGFSVPINFISIVPGTARRFFVPFTRNGVVQGGCDRYYDEMWRKLSLIHI